MSETKAARTQRLAEALRANLRRRKAAGQRTPAATNEPSVEQTGAGHPDANEQG